MIGKCSLDNVFTILSLIKNDAVPSYLSLWKLSIKPILFIRIGFKVLNLVPGMASFHIPLQRILERILSFYFFSRVSYIQIIDWTVDIGIRVIISFINHYHRIFFLERLYLCSWLCWLCWSCYRSMLCRFFPDNFLVLFSTAVSDPHYQWIFVI